MPEKATSEKSTTAAPEKTRLERLKAERGEHYVPASPPLECGEYMLDHLWAAGPCVGDGPLTHGEIRDYQLNTGIRLSEWEATTLRSLSMAYLAESRRAVKRDCPPPWQESPDASSLVVADARDSIRALARL